MRITAGGLFVAGREKPVLDLVAAADAKAGAPVSITVCALDSDGKLEEVGTATATIPAPGQTAKVDLSGVPGCLFLTREKTWSTRAGGR